MIMSVIMGRYCRSCSRMESWVSLRSTGSDQIPAATLAVARAAFPRGSLAIRIRDALGVLFEDEDFAAAFSARGRPALSPARLALVSILQFGEGLSDRQAAEAVRARIDWKYALGLELTNAGFDYSVLSEFRDRLIAGSLEQSLLDTILERAATAGLLRAGGRQRTDSTHVLMAMRTMNRLEHVHETVRAALNALAAAPDWLLAQAEPEWFERYEARVEDYRLPKNKAERIQLGHEIGADGSGVLHAVYSQAAPGWLRDIPAVQTLRHVWIQQYVTIDDHLRWRTPDEQPPGTIRQISPYDSDARTGTKRDSHWDGYKVHRTEACDTDAPHLITNVITAPSPGSDYEATNLVQEALAARTDAGSASGRQGVHERAQPRPLRSPRHRTAGTDDARQRLAKRRGQRLRRQRLHHRLGQPRHDLSHRSHQLALGQ